MSEQDGLFRVTEAKLHVEPRMPDGTPAPWVMTDEEALRFMRWGSGEQDLVSVRRSWKEKGLVPIIMGQRTRYRLTDVLKFIERRI